MKPFQVNKVFLCKPATENVVKILKKLFHNKGNKFKATNRISKNVLCHEITKAIKLTSIGQV